MNSLTIGALLYLTPVIGSSTWDIYMTLRWSSSTAKALVGLLTFEFLLLDLTALTGSYTCHNCVNVRWGFSAVKASIVRSWLTIKLLLLTLTGVHRAGIVLLG